MHAIVDALPMVLQWPRLRIIADSDARKSASSPTHLPHARGDFVQVAVARCEVGRGVGEGDASAAVEGGGIYADSRRMRGESA
jgi:hypothetical protein